MALIIIVAILLGLGIAALVNGLSYWVGLKRLDVHTWAYIPWWSLWIFVGIIGGLLLSIGELTMNPTRKWSNTWGGRIASGSIAFFFAVWAGSILSGLPLKYLLNWPDGPTVKP